MKSIFILAIITCIFRANAQTNDVVFAGSLTQISKNPTKGIASVDSLIRNGLYAAGVMQGYSGEILILNGVLYTAQKQEHHPVQIGNNPETHAVLIAYTEEDNWTPYPMPPTIRTMADLEAYLLKHIKTDNKPFAFRINGPMAAANISIAAVPKEAALKSAEDLNKYKQTMVLRNIQCELLGFFDPKNSSGFLPKGRSSYMQLIDAPRMQMGFVESLQFVSGACMLWLPAGIEFIP